MLVLYSFSLGLFIMIFPLTPGSSAPRGRFLEHHSSSHSTAPLNTGSGQGPVRRIRAHQSSDRLRPIRPVQGLRSQSIADPTRLRRLTIERGCGLSRTQTIGPSLLWGIQDFVMLWAP